MVGVVGVVGVAGTVLPPTPHMQGQKVDTPGVAHCPAPQAAQEGKESTQPAHWGHRVAVNWAAGSRWQLLCQTSNHQSGRRATPRCAVCQCHAYAMRYGRAWDEDNCRTVSTPPVLRKGPESTVNDILPSALLKSAAANMAAARTSRATRGEVLWAIVRRGRRVRG